MPALEAKGIDIEAPILRDSENEGGVPDVEQADAMPEETSSSVRGPFPIVDTPGHGATGNIRVIETADQSLVRYENYDGTNGPDLYVYLANDLDAEDFFSLGRARGNMGNINYDVPDNINVNDYKYVMTWCQAFGVLFDYAEIN